MERSKKEKKARRERESESEKGWERWEIMVLRPNKFYLFKETASDAMPRFRHLF